MAYCVFDIEVDAKTTYKRFCNPLDPDNTIVCLQRKDQGKEAKFLYKKTGISRDITINLNGVDLLVGSNIKFDLLYLWGNKSLQDFFRRGGRIWDTCLAEYLLNGQDFGKISLDALSEQYGGSQKHTFVKEALESGLMFSQIDEDVATHYAVEDVINTELVYLGQLKKAQEYGMMELLTNVYMEGLLAVIEQEYNGIFIDKAVAQKEFYRNTEIREQANVALLQHISAIWPSHITFNPSSTQHVSCILFGGELPYVAKENVGFYKNGKVKTVNVKKLQKIAGLGFKPSPSWRSAKSGYYSVKDEVLQQLRLWYPKETIFNTILTIREVGKFLGTYFWGEKDKGYLSLLHPHSGCLHAEFKTFWTATGRLSAEHPNAQNLPEEFLPLVTSRFGSEGCIISADESQLEIVIQAYLSGCKKMQEDITNGVDFHYKRLAYALGIPYEKILADAETDDGTLKEQRRRIAKPISFQKAYGAYPTSIAMKSGIPVAMVKEVFDKEDKEYPEIEQYYDNIMARIEGNGIATDKPLAIFNKMTNVTTESPGETHYKYIWQEVTTKKYAVTDKAVITEKGRLFRYLPLPQIKNRPIQGTAADIGMDTAGRLFRQLLINNRDDILLIDMIHDSFIFDCKKARMPEFCRRIRQIMESTLQVPGISDLALKCSIGVGDTAYIAKKGEE